jgi:phosphomannomutase/phosphoglucomutase
VVAEEIERWQGVPFMERSGHAFIKTTLRREQAGLAGEISGHYFFGELQRDDALYATLLMLQILAAGDRSLSASMDEIPRYPITPDLRLPCPPEVQRSILAELQTAFAGQPVSTIDGVRIGFDNGWALVRSSVTEPLITARFEGRTGADLAQIQAEVARRVPALGALVSAYE